MDAEVCALLVDPCPLTGSVLIREKITRAEPVEITAGHAAILGTDFLISIVEAHHVRKNGNVVAMDSGLKAQQELTKIEQQIERLQALEGQNEERQELKRHVEHGGQVQFNVALFSSAVAAHR